jgi:hypothetical protein
MYWYFLKSFVLSQNSRGLVGNDNVELEATLQQVTQRLVAIQEGLQVGHQRLPWPG